MRFFLLKLKPNKTALLAISLLLICVSLIACAPEPSDNTPPTQMVSIQLSDELSTIFNETCALCHLSESTGAPKVGDTDAWEKILSKGMDATLERVMNGYGGMPPAGQCFECSPEQLSDLIRYMQLKR